MPVPCYKPIRALKEYVIRFNSRLFFDLIFDLIIYNYYGKIIARCWLIELKVAAKGQFIFLLLASSSCPTRSCMEKQT